MTAADFPSGFSSLTQTAQLQGELPTQRECMRKLSIQDDYWYHVEEPLSTQSEATVQRLYLLLKDIFTNKINNEERGEIIRAVLRAPMDQWDRIMQQVSLIMPISSRGHDVQATTQILISVADPARRSQLVTSVLDNITDGMSSFDRYTVLKQLSEQPQQEPQPAVRGGAQPPAGSSCNLV